MAKRFLIEKGYNFEEIDIEENNISREEMASISKGLTVPQIIINDLPIGGFDNLIQLFTTEPFK
jgi:glutaredoxin